MNKYIEIKILKNPKLAKCECCDKVKDIYYKAMIYDVDDEGLLVGDLELCKNCGSNFNKIIGNKNEVDERIVKEFNFTFNKGE